MKVPKTEKEMTITPSPLLTSAPGTQGSATCQKRPTIVTVVGIFGIVIGVMGLLGLPFSIALVTGSSQQSEALDLLMKDTLYHSWMVIQVWLGAIASGLWLATGIGLLRLRMWARAASLYLLSFGIMMQIISLVVIIAVFLFYLCRMVFATHLRKRWVNGF